MGLNVLSLCDGMSCGQIALKELGIDVDNYYSSEIYKEAIKVTQDNFPNTIQLGDVISLSDNDGVLSSLPKIDLIMFGFPCRSLSNATAGREEYNNGLKGVSGIFYNCLEILNYIKKNNNPNVKFLVENVNSSNKSDIDLISKELGVNYTYLDSNTVSAQDRERLYWTNLDFEVIPNTPCDVVIKDILDEYVDEKYYHKQPFVIDDITKKVCATLQVKCHDIGKRIYNINYKCATLTACRGGYRQKKILIDGRCRKLTPNEYRKLQNIPSWYKMNVADSHVYNMCGDGWTIGAIKIFLKALKEEK